MSIAYGFSENGYFTGIVPMQRNPLKLGDFLLPSNATLVAPPTGYTEDKQPKFNQDLGTWVLVESEYKLALDAEKLQLTNEYGVSLYEEDIQGGAVLRDSAEVDAETNIIIKSRQIDELKNVMDANIINKAFELTGATSIDSASAFFQGYTLRASSPAEYLSEGLVAHYAIGNYVLGDALDTIAKITEFYNLINIAMDKYRNSEINNYIAARNLLA